MSWETVVFLRLSLLWYATIAKAKLGRESLWAIDFFIPVSSR